MKTQFLNFLVRAALLSAILIVTSVASVHAQSLSNRARFNIPFDFAFGDTKLPAGKYSIGRALHSSDDLIQSVADQDGRSKAAVRTRVSRVKNGARISVRLCVSALECN